MNDYLIRWQPSPLPDRLLAFVYVTDDDGVSACGHLSFTREQARAVHQWWPGSQQGWPDE